MDDVLSLASTDDGESDGFWLVRPSSTSSSPVHAAASAAAPAAATKPGRVRRWPPPPLRPEACVGAAGAITTTTTTTTPASTATTAGYIDAVAASAASSSAAASSAPSSAVSSAASSAGFASARSSAHPSSSRSGSGASSSSSGGTASTPRVLLEGTARFPSIGVSAETPDPLYPSKEALPQTLAEQDEVWLVVPGVTLGANMPDSLVDSDSDDSEDIPVVKPRTLGTDVRCRRDGGGAPTAACAQATRYVPKLFTAVSSPSAPSASVVAAAATAKAAAAAVAEVEDEGEGDDEDDVPFFSLKDSSKSFSLGWGRLSTPTSAIPRPSLPAAAPAAVAAAA
eukprot:Rhum_TRINITY_DN14345_c36_g1::Rhum_TRINITY_DN14345_c36_g1_i1::g.84924::m.84924